MREQNLDIPALLQKANFDDPAYQLITIGRITKRRLVLDGTTVLLVKFPVGASVAEDAAPPGKPGTGMCAQPHVAFVLEGGVGVRQQDGSQQTYSAGDVMMLPPHHDVWTVGDQDCVFVEFLRGTNDVYDFWP